MQVDRSSGAGQGLYFHGYTHPGHHPSLWGAISAPVASLRFFLALLGNSLAWSEEVALPVGVVLFAAALVTVFLVVREGMKVGEGIRQARLVRARILLNYRYQPDDVLATMIYPNPKTARERAEYLERMQYNVFRKR